jgi:hypothetical protein
LVYAAQYFLLQSRFPRANIKRKHSNNASASLTAVRKCSVWNFGEIFFFLIFQIHPKPRVSVSSMGLRICTHEARPYDETLSAHALGGKAAELTRAHSGG